MLCKGSSGLLIHGFIQEQLHERDTAIMELQRTLDDKDKELHAIRLDHEAVSAKTFSSRVFFVLLLVYYNYFSLLV